VKLAYTTELVENVGLATKIDLFSNYGNNPQNIDINWGSVDFNEKSINSCLLL